MGIVSGYSIVYYKKYSYQNVWEEIQIKDLHNSLDDIAGTVYLKGENSKPILSKIYIHNSGDAYSISDRRGRYIIGEDTYHPVVDRNGNMSLISPKNINIGDKHQVYGPSGIINEVIKGVSKVPEIDRPPLYMIWVVDKSDGAIIVDNRILVY